MIIIRKDQLNLVEPNNTILKSSPALYDFEKNKSSALAISNVLFERMKELGGIGLSANQVGINLKIFVMGTDHNKLAVFNPEIIEYFGEEISFKEGCLSFPGLFIFVKRPAGIRVKFQDIEGNLKEGEFTGLTARIFQHEYDHMQGKDFTERVSKIKLDLAKKKYLNLKKKIIKKHAVQTMIGALNESENLNLQK